MIFLVLSFTSKWSILWKNHHWPAHSWIICHYFKTKWCHIMSLFLSALQWRLPKKFETTSKTLIIPRIFEENEIRRHKVKEWSFHCQFPLILSICAMIIYMPFPEYNVLNLTKNISSWRKVRLRYCPFDKPIHSYFTNKT